MSPKEKAIELFNFYEGLCKDFTRGVSIKDMSKESAIFAAREVTNHCKMTAMVYDLSFDDSEFYWKEVINEIEKI